MILGKAEPESGPPVPPPKCGKCGADMEEGFIAAFGPGLENAVSSWVAGKPAYGLMGSAKVWDKEEHLIKTFRCSKCGYLESYAPGK